MHNYQEYSLLDHNVMKGSIYPSIGDWYEQIGITMNSPKGNIQTAEYVFHKNDMYKVLCGNVNIDTEEETTLEESNQFNDIAITSFDDIAILSKPNIDALIYFIKNPDEGSDFEKQIAKIPQSILEDDNKLLSLLFQMGYAIQAKLDGNKNIISFVAYQKDKDANLLKVFKLHTNEDQRGKRLTVKIIEKLLQDNMGIDIKVGKGPNETNEVNESSKRLIEIYEEDGYHVDKENFIIFNRYQ